MGRNGVGEGGEEGREGRGGGGNVKGGGWIWGEGGGGG